MVGGGFRFERDGEIARLTFARPDKRNAISHDMWSAVPDFVAEADGDPAVKVLLLTGSGQDFSAGADIAEFRDLRSSPAGAVRYDQAVDAAVRALAGMRKPSVAMIHGNCIGGGCQLSVAAAFRFAAADARFGITPAKLGIVYDFESTRRLVGLVGQAHARYLLLSGELVDAARAREMGLVNEVFEAADLEKSTMDFVRTLCARSQTSILGMNRIIEKILAGLAEPDDEVAAIRAAAVRGDDYAEGVSAFLERRRPDFT